MAKADVVAAQKQAIIDGESAVIEQALGAAYDGGANDQKASDGSFTQADIDAAVAKAQADDQVVLQGVQQQLSDMTAKEQSEEQQVATLQDVISKIKALLG